MNETDPKPNGSLHGAAAAGWTLLGVFVIGAACLKDIYSGTFTIQGRVVHHVQVWQCLYVLGFAGFVLLLLVFRRSGVRSSTLLVAAFLLRLPLLWCEPNEDCNRYLWEGRIQQAGFNPYVFPPDSDELVDLRDSIWEGVNKKHYATIYPPLSQLEFRLLAAVAYDVKTAQAVHAALDFGVVLALAGILHRLRRPNWYLAGYALCPLVLASFAHAGHNDSLMILAVMGFVAAGVAKRWTLAGMALGLAVLAKTTPVILLALLVRRSWTAIAVAVLTIAAGYGFYIDAGRDLFAVLVDFPTQSRFNNPIDELRFWVNETFDLRILLRPRNYAAIGFLVGLTAYRAWRPRDLIDDARCLLAAILLLLPIVHFWYLTWLVAFLALSPRGYRAWFVLAGSMVLYWNADWAEQSGGSWGLSTGVVLAVWIPFLLTWSAELLLEKRPSKSHAG